MGIEHQHTKIRLFQIFKIFPRYKWAWSFEHVPPSEKTGAGRNSIKNTIKNENNPGSNFSKDLQGYVHKSPDYYGSSTRNGALKN